jgi:uncharacterized SAM-binding protein YcdF (DUF218 family)
VRRRLAFVLIAAAVSANLVLCGMGYFVFNRAAISPLGKADAIVVLAGEHDGREEYGISLAQRGLAPTVVLRTTKSKSSVHRHCLRPHVVKQ